MGEFPACYLCWLRRCVLYTRAVSYLCCKCPTRGPREAIRAIRFSRWHPNATEPSIHLQALSRNDCELLICWTTNAVKELATTYGPSNSPVARQKFSPLRLPNQRWISGMVHHFRHNALAGPSSGSALALCGASSVGRMAARSGPS